MRYDQTSLIDYQALTSQAVAFQTSLLFGQTNSVPAAGGGGGFTNWAPTDLGAQLLAWWNADDLANGAVSAWADRKGSLTPAQATGGFQPIKAATSFNAAYGGVTLDGTDDRLLLAGVGSLPVGTAGGELHALASQDAAGATAGDRNLFSYGAAGSAAARWLVRSPVTSINRFRVKDGTSTLANLTGDFTGPHIVSGAWAGVLQYGWFDGAPTSPASGGSSFNTIGTNICIGAIQSGGVQFWQGVIRHIFATVALTDARRDKLTGWMAWDSGLTSLLPSGHSYKTQRPYVENPSVFREPNPNLCPGPETFDLWTALAGIVITPNALADPEGNLTAELLTDNAVGTTGVTSLNTLAFTIGVSPTVYRYSVYIKAGTTPWVQLAVANLGVLSIQAYFNTATGAVGSTAGIVAAGADAPINGWIRCWLTFVADVADTSGTGRILFASANGVATVLRNGTQTMNVWLAQLAAV